MNEFEEFKKELEEVNWHEKFINLPRFNFIKTGEFDAVTAWENIGGTWIDQHDALQIVESMQEEINVLKKELAFQLTKSIMGSK